MGKKVLWIMIILLPVLSVAYLLFPNSPELELFGNTFIISYPASWSTYIWHVGLLTITALVCITLIILLPKKYLPWQIIILLSQLLFLNVWYLERYVVSNILIGGHSELITILVCSAVVFIVLAIRSRRKPSDREKLEEMQRVVDQLTQEDLPALFCAFLDIEISMEEMKDTDFISNWKVILKRDIEFGKVITTTAMEKFMNDKAVQK